MTQGAITRRPSRFAGDEEGLLALFRAVAAEPGDGSPVIPDEVRMEYVDAEPGWVRDHVVWESGGRLVAVSAVWHEVDDPVVRAYGHVDVHPDVRGAGLEDEVAQAMREATSALVGRPVALRVSSRGAQLWKIAMLERNGFVPERHFLRMRRDLTTPVPSPEVPAGYAIRPLAAGAEVAAWCAALEDAFSEGYDPPRFTVEDRRHRMGLADYLPEADLVAVTPDGSIAGLAWAARQVTEDGDQRGIVDYVAVLAPHRGRGLARALLLSSMGVLRDLGLDHTLLVVDLENADGALGLYESTGFTRDATFGVHLAEIP